MANPIIQQIAENLGITQPINGSWIQAIAIYYGATEPINGSWMQTIAQLNGATEPVNGSWTQAWAIQLGQTEPINGTWLGAILEGTSGPSFPIPTNLTNTAQGYTTLDYTWNAGGTETSWEVEFGPAGIGGNFATAVTETYQMTSLDPDTLYELRVRAIISAGTFSNYTAPVVAQTDTIGVPANLAASGETPSSFEAYWDAVADADSYEVEVTGEGIFTSSTTSVTISGLSAETTYDFRARTIIEGFEGAWTEFENATTLSAASFSVSGGTVTTDGDYTYHTFNSTDELVVEGTGEIDYLIVAGGGGGGGGRSFGSGPTQGAGGGGGAGGVITGSTTITTSTESITVGAGGAGGRGESDTFNGSTQGVNGGNSEFLTLTALGGGGGGRGIWSTGNGLDGGSGGGGGATTNSDFGGAGLQPTSTDGGEGNDGGDAALRPNSSSAYNSYGAGGGGGATSVGTNGTTSSEGTGGSGLVWYNSTEYARGGDANTSTTASANTGNGGGGGVKTGGNGGAGGDGIVIIRYLTT